MSRMRLFLMYLGHMHQQMLYLSDPVIEFYMNKARTQDIEYESYE
jgi:hypothetical protein